MPGTDEEVLVIRGRRRVLRSHDRYCHRHLRLAGRQPIYISATPNPAAALDEIKRRWDSATIAATFYAPAVTEAHHIASAAAMALPIAERRPAIVLRDGNVDEARTLIAQLAKREFGSQLSGSLRQKQSGART